jgi:hypothetical protein
MLKRCNRSRGFSAKFARHIKVHDNYRIFQGLNCKRFTAQPWWPAATVLQIPIILGHGRSRGAGQKKEDDEEIRFHTLLTVRMHRGGRILSEKRVAAVCFVETDVQSWIAALAPGDAQGGARGGGQGARRGTARRRDLGWRRCRRGAVGGGAQG